MSNTRNSLSFWSPLLRKTGASLALCATICLVGCQNRYETGLENLAEDRIFDAERQARIGLKENPKDARYHLLLARALVRQATADPKDPDITKITKALPHALKAFEDKSLKADAGRILGKIHWDMGKPIKAVDAWRAARAADPKSIGNSDYFYCLRTALATAMTFENYDKAMALRRELKAITETHPELLDPQKNNITPNEVINVKEAISDEAFHDTLEAMAQDLERNNKFKEALQAYSQLIERKPDKAQYYFAQGRLLLRTGKEDEAKKAFRAFATQGTTTQSKEYITRLQQVAEHVERRGVRGLAIDFYKELLNAHKGKASAQRANYIKRLAQLHYALNERKDGRKYTRMYLEEFKAIHGTKTPMRVDHYFNTVNIAIGYDQTIVDSILEEALKEAAPNLRVAERLANAYARRASSGDVERVWKTYTSRLKESRSALQQAANWARRRRNFDLSAYFYEKLAQLPNSTSYDWFYLAQIYAQQGKVEDLKNAIKKYLDKAGTNRRSLREAADIYTNQNMYDEAEKIYKKAQKAYSEDMSIADRFAYLYVRWGKPQSVHTVYKTWLKARGNQSEDYIHVGNWLMRQNREDEALGYLQTAAKKGDLASLLQIANVYARQQRDIELRKVLDDYLKRHTHRPDALNRVLTYYRRAGMNDEAAKVLEELIALNPNDSYKYEQLIEIYLQQGRESDITKLLKAYIKQTNYPYRRLESIARRLGYRGYSKAMLRFYQDMLQSSKTPDPRIYRLIGDAYYNMYNRRHYRSYRYRRYYSRRGYYPSYQNLQSSNVYLKKAKRFYEEYFKKASLKSSQLYDFAYRMRSNQFWKLSAMAYERIIKTQKRPRSNTYMDYGTVLFNMGENIKAEEMLKKYYNSARVRSDSYAERAANLLMRYRRYEAAETYLQRIMRGKSRSYSRRAFERLAQIYRQTDRQKEIRALIEEYLKASSQPASARYTILRTLLNAGMWDLAVVQLEQMSKTQSDSRRLEVGQTLYKAGKTERAKTVLNNYAANSTQPERAWVRVGQFYQTRGMAKDAQKAYDKAVSAGPDKPEARAVRAIFLISQGKNEQAQKDIEKVLKTLSPYRQSRYFNEVVAAFEEYGQYDLATTYAKRALPLSSRGKDRFLNIIARTEFASGDPTRRDRMLQQLKAAGLSLDRVVRLQSYYGFKDAARATILEEVAVGDYVSASRVIMDHAQLFTRQGGIKRLMRAVQPLLDRTRPDATLEDKLGAFLIKEGAYEQGALYLRAALDRGITDNRMLLAHTYLKLKAYPQANKLFQEELANTSSTAQKDKLNQIAARYSASGEHKRFESLLEHFVRDKRFVAAATPLLLERMLERRAVLGAVNIASSIFKLKDPTKKNEVLNLFASDGLDTDQAKKLYLSATKIIASYGYTNEALILLEQIPTEHQNDASVKALTVRLEAAKQGGNIAESIKNMSAVLENTLEDQRKLIALGRILMLSGHHEQAMELAQKFIKHGDFDISTQAFKVIAQSARATGKEKDLPTWIKAYIDHNKDKVRARGQAATIMSSLGLDNLALNLTRDTAKRIPTSSYIRSYANHAFNAGSKKDLDAALKTLWRVDYAPQRTMEGYLSSYSSMAPHMVTNLIEQMKTLSPKKNTVVMARAQAAFQKGDVGTARGIVLDHLKHLKYNPLAIEEVFSTLFAQALYVEIAKAIAPKLPKDKISPKAHLSIGVSLAKLGMPKDAKPHLDAYLKSIPDQADGQVELAFTLLNNELNALALPLTEAAIRAQPERPLGYFVRGLANLGMGKTANVEKDIDKALAQGVDRHAMLMSVIEKALETKQYSIATKYSNQLINGISLQGADDNDLTALTLSMWAKPKSAKAGIAFVEKHHPHLLQQRVKSIKIISALSNLYEYAGANQRAFDIYQRRIQQQLIADPSDRDMSTYLNNLAYTYTTTNTKPNEAERLVRLALAADFQRRPSYIDTLGWVYYRQGKYAQAEEEIRRAIRSSSGSRASNKELYEHLAVILEARQQYSTAAWVRAYTNMLK